MNIFSINISDEKGTEKHPVPDIIKLGDVVLEVTQIGKTCHGDGCSIYWDLGKCIMPGEGIFCSEKPNALLSRGIAGVMKQTLVYTLPGSVRAVEDYMREILKTMEHLILMTQGIGH